MSGRPRKIEEVWHVKAAELMVRHSLSVRRAAEALGVALSEGEASNLIRSKMFQKLLWTERNKFHRELADDPLRSKQTAIGVAVLAIQKLAEAGQWKDVVEAVFKLGRLEGWVGSEGNVNIFQNLTAEELEEAKKKIQAEMKESRLVQ